jgi:hypothetical protein
MANINRWWWPIPNPGDPADISEWLLERIKVEDQAQLARAELTFQKAVLQAQLERLNVIERLAGFNG